MPAPSKKPNINLLIKEEKEETFSGQLLAWSLSFGRYIIIIVQIVVLSVFFARFKLDRDQTDLKEAVAQKQAVIESVVDLEREVRRTQRKLSYLGQITLNQDLVSKILRFLQENTPRETTFAILAISREKITFSATTKTLGEFSFLLGKLGEGGKFTEVALEDINRRADGRVEFKITARVNLSGFN